MLEKQQKHKIKHAAKLLVENACRFVINVLFVYVFAAVFGSENMLLGVAVGVGFTLFPTSPTGIRPRTMAGLIAVVTTLAGIAGQTALLSPWLALPLNFIMMLIIMLTTIEPMVIKPSIIFLLIFVFSQATPVPWEMFPSRLISSLGGGLFNAAVTLLVWHKVGLGFQGSGRNLREQIGICAKHRGYVLRAALGISLAMFAGMILHLKKPLWISIVVMSLTQPELIHTVERIKARVTGTLIGIALFMLIFQILIPQEYAMPVILFIGYLSFFTPEYKHKQIVNAINALNASLVLLDTSTAIRNRFFSLLGGIAIVTVLWLIQLGYQKMRSRSQNTAAAQT